MKRILAIVVGSFIVVAFFLTGNPDNRATPILNQEKTQTDPILNQEKAQTEQPIIVDPCTLSQNPANYNHKLVEVSGYIAHSFENFSLVVPCKTDASIWIEYGGSKGSNTMICCGVPAEEQRRKNLEIEGIEVPLFDDENFKGFNAIINKEYDTIIKATVIGRYFSGKPSTGADEQISWTGFGHLGVYSLLAIQQVKSFEAHDRLDIDYRDTLAGKDTLESEKFWFNTVTYWTEDNHTAFDLQKIATDAERNSARNNPAEVAKDYLAKTLGINKSLLTEPQEIKALPGVIVYEWRLSETKGFRVTVGHPYLLLAYLKDPANFPWIGVAVFNKANNDGKTTVADIPKLAGKK